MIIKNQNCLAWVLKKRNKIFFKKVEDVVGTGAIANTIVPLVTTATYGAYNSHAATTFIIDDDLESVLRILPNQSLRIPKVCSGFVHVHNVESSSSILLKFDEPILLLNFQIQN